MDEWISMWYTRIMECYTALKRKEIQTYATTWKILEGIMVSKISSHTKKVLCDSTYMIYLEQIYIEHYVYHIVIENRMVVARVWGEEGMGVIV